MRVLVACEYSGIVREAFRKRGHDVWSCDLLPAEDGSPYHCQVDVLQLLKEEQGWDLMIAHPPCTYLCNSGVWALKPNGLNNEKVMKRWVDMQDARAFFMTLWDQPIPKICIENPVPHGYSNLPKYAQSIQPYQFGDDASKRTCLWLKGLPNLTIPSQDAWFPPRIVESGPYAGKKRWSNQTDAGQNKLGPSANRGLERARTYQGIADAFADQWG
jgi:hypothetical protein